MILDLVMWGKNGAKTLRQVLGRIDEVIPRARCRQNIHLIREDSHALATLNMVKKALKGRKLDLLFIDGDHTYKGVKRDFEMHNKLASKGGIIAFHDVCPHLPQTGCEVDKFWCEIKDEYEHVEIVRDWKQGWAGIGVLYV